MLRELKRLALSSVNYNLKLKSASGSLTISVINDVGRAHLDEHEPHMDALLKRFYTPGTLLIDVGVNIGADIGGTARDMRSAGQRDVGNKHLLG